MAARVHDHHKRVLLSTERTWTQQRSALTGKQRAHGQDAARNPLHTYFTAAAQLLHSPQPRAVSSALSAAARWVARLATSWVASSDTYIGIQVLNWLRLHVPGLKLPRLTLTMAVFLLCMARSPRATEHAR